MFTVKELVEMLKEFPQDYPIFHGTERRYEPINSAIAKTNGVVVLTSEVVNGEGTEDKPKRDFKDWYLGKDKPLCDLKTLNYEGREYERNKN